ncbi:MAG: hypothetical protein QOE70_5768 [Chthoniobacter sp.]|nr:hypothetical protein [Chthoniobacter sp.]
MLFGFLLEHIPDRIYFKDKASRFIRVSRAKAERHGISDPSRMIGKIDLDLFTFEYAMQALEDEQDILRTGQPIIGKVEKETLPNGQTRWALTTKMPLRNSCGEIIGTCGISKDVTALKEMEDELADANAELSRTLTQLKTAQAQLVEAEKAQTAARLAAGVAHEVRNPLNILGAGIELLGADRGISADGTAGMVLAEMRDALRRADAVICTLMDSSKDTAIVLTRCNLHALIDRSIESHQRDFATRHVTVTRDFAADLPPLAIDAERITTVLDCLLRNALDAMSTGDGELLVRTRCEQVAASDTEFEPGARSGQRQRIGDTVATLEIEDSGCGIPPASLGAIFDPFFTTKPTGSGTGLGLTVCRKILELHRASIAVTNRPERGVKVRIAFPS